MALKRMQLDLLVFLSIYSLLPENIQTNTINRPSLCPYAMWNPNGSLIYPANSSYSDAQTFFIDYNNRIYIGAIEENKVYVWSEGFETLLKTLVLEKDSIPTSIFKYSVSDLYVASAGKGSHRITRWTENSPNGTFVTETDDYCWDLYVTRDTLFCSMPDTHQVWIFPLQKTSVWSNNRGQKGSCGSTSKQLCFPSGIFCLNDSSLYVADTENDRIQMFRRDQIAATTEVGITGRMIMALTKPNGIILDGLDSLIISEFTSQRIIRCQSWSGCKSIIEGSGALFALFYPSHLSLDRFGNLYSLTPFEGLIFKFDLEQNNCYVPVFPSLCEDAEWAVNATTIANETTFGGHVRSIFIHNDGHLYASDHVNNRIIVFSLADLTERKYINTTLLDYSDLFIGLDGDIYFSQDTNAKKIFKWTSNSIKIDLVGESKSACTGLFIDPSNILYCSQRSAHQVIRTSSRTEKNLNIVVAGTGAPGSGPNQLNGPRNIFIDFQYNLYVTDGNNYRIQKFRRGELTGTTVAGNGIPTGLFLKLPSDCLVDRSDSLYIADNENHRIIRVMKNQWRCIAGCSGTLGSGAHQFSKPYNLQLDQSGNLYVADEFNFRMQRFELIQSCSICSSPIVAIQPSPSHLTFQPDEDLYFTATIQWPCPSIPNHLIQWYFDRTSPNSVASQFPIITRNQTEFSLPSAQLSNGTFILNFTVEFDGLVRPIFVVSHIDTKPSNIHLKLIEQNVKKIVHFIEYPLHLSPIKYMNDSQKWNYRYSCRLFLPSSPFRFLNDPEQECFPIPDSWNYSGPNQSTLLIGLESFLPDRTYQFLLELINPSSTFDHHATYLLVETKSMRTDLLKIRCLFDRKSLQDPEFNVMNRFHQLTLFVEGLTQLQTIEWELYEGFFDQMRSSIRWSRLISTNFSLHSTFNEKNLTIRKEFFETFRSIDFWRFRLVSKLDGRADFLLEMNDSPSNGSCSIFPLSGDIWTIFTVTCSNWFDQHGIEDYSFLTSTSKTYLFSSKNSTNEIPLIASLNPSKKLLLTVKIRDKFGAATEFELKPISIVTNFVTIGDFSNPLFQLIFHPDQNIAAARIHSFLQIFDEINDEFLRLAEKNENFSLVHFTIGSLRSEKMFDSSFITNVSSIEQKTANSMRKLFVTIISNWKIENENHLRLQSSILAQLTRTLAQMSPNVSISASNKCLTLATNLSKFSRKFSFEELQLTSSDILQCSTNSLMGIHGPLQNRLQIDANLNEIHRISRQHDRIVDHLSFLLNSHLNNNESLKFDTDVVFLSLEKRSNELIRNLTVPMAMFDNEFSSSFTNLSRSSSLTSIDENGRIRHWKTLPKEFFISHDPLLRVSPMILYNITSKGVCRYHFLNLSHLNPQLKYSIHFEFSPREKNRSFEIFSHFDPRPTWKYTDDFDHSMIFNGENETLTFVVNPFVRNEFSSIVFGIRSLNPIETIVEYFSRFYLSSCFFLDDEFQWRSDGLTVGPQTNHHQTQCLSAN